MQATEIELVGRERELAQIAAFVESTGALVVEGEPGIGKTTLWRAGVGLARERGQRVLAARPAEADEALSFTTLADLLADLHDEVALLPLAQGRPLEAALLLDDAGSGVVEPRAIAVGVLTLFRSLAQHGPLLVAIDDTQWVDRPSALAISYALRRAPIRALLARRLGVAERIDRHEAERLTIGPLSLGAFRRLLDARFAQPLPRPLLRRIHAQAGGNPFYGLELARALEARSASLSPEDELPVPSDLERLLAERLRRLPRGSAEALAAVAALADPVAELVREDVLDAALDSGVLVLDGSRVRFEHPLLAAAAYNRLPPQRRRALHRRLADLVADPEERARHLARGADGHDATLAAELEAAAAHARARGAPGAAAELADWALRLTELGDQEARVRRTVAASEYLALAGSYAEARKPLEEALATNPVGADRARLLMQLMRVSEQPPDEVMRRLEEALDDAGDDAAVAASVLIDLTWIANVERLHAADGYARRALELADQSGDSRLVVRALGVLASNRFVRGQGIDSKLMERAL